MERKSNPLATAIILMIIFWSVVYTQCSAQNRITASVLHDVKLGLGLDSKHNNGKSVIDIIGNINLEGKQFEWYYFSTQLQYEYANLQQTNMHRYTVNFLWNFNQLVIPKTTFSLGFGGSMIHREGQSYLSYGLVNDIKHPLNKNIALVAKNEVYRRGDLYTPKFGYNFSVGINFLLHQK